MEKVKNFCVENGATILTGVGVVGVVSTAVLAATSTPKALRLLEEKERVVKETYGEELTNFEKVIAVTPAYIPAVLSGLATASCILGANHINKKQQASLMSAYTYLATAFGQYRRKVKEVFGEEGDAKVCRELEKESDLYLKYGSLHETRLFYDELSKRYFEMSMYEMKEAEYNMNRMFNFLGALKLNEVYEFFNLGPTEYGETVGWAALRDWEVIGYSWIEATFDEIETPDGLQAFSIKFNMEPTKDYLQWY